MRKSGRQSEGFGNFFRRLVNPKAEYFSEDSCPIGCHRQCVDLSFVNRFFHVGNKSLERFPEKDRMGVGEGKGVKPSLF